jgi:hypothetical protein
MKKKVTFDLSQNQIFFFDKYITKHKYKTKYNLIHSILYKNINDSTWFKILPYPTHFIFDKNLTIGIYHMYHININYKVNVHNKICLYISNDIQKPEFFSKYFDLENLNIIKFRKIIIDYIRELCSNNNIY